MSDLINLYAEEGRNIIGDDSSPTLSLENSSTGEALKLKGISKVLNIDATAQSSATVAPIVFSASMASGAVARFNIGLISTASLTKPAAAIPVYIGGINKVVYLVGYEIA